MGSLWLPVMRTLTFRGVEYSTLISTGLAFLVATQRHSTDSIQLLNSNEPTLTRLTQGKKTAFNVKEHITANITRLIVSIMDNFTPTTLTS